MSENPNRSWGWAILFSALAASHVVRLLFGAPSRFGNSLAAVGFAGLALVAIYKPSEFMSVSWRQVTSPSKLRGRALAGVVIASLLVMAMAMQWFKI